MRPNRRLSLLTLLCAFSAACHVLAQSSANSISFQGALTGVTGQPLPNANYNLTFKFYDVSTNGIALATSNVPSVPVTGGIASTPIPVEASWFNGQTRYLGLTIDGGQELTPRVLITSVPYALSAQSLGNQVFVNNDGLVGIGTTNPVYSLHVEQKNGGLVIGPSHLTNGSSYVHLSMSSPTNGFAKLDVIQSQGTSYGNLALLPNGGKVGIGTTNPAYSLHVAQRDGSDGLLVGAPEVVAGASYILISVTNLTNGDGKIDVIRSQGTSFGNLTLLSGGGTVGIGKSPSNERKLDVAGNIRASLDIQGSRIFCTGLSYDCDGNPGGVFSSMDGLAVKNLWVENIIHWDGVEVCVPAPAGLNSRGSKLSSVRDQIQTSSADDRSATVVDELNQQFEKALRERDAEIQALKNQTASLDKRLNDLERAMQSPTQKR